MYLFGDKSNSSVNMECGPLVLREELKLKKVTWGMIFFSKGAERNGGGGEVDRQLLVVHKIQLLNSRYFAAFFQFFFVSFFLNF